MTRTQQRALNYELYNYTTYKETIKEKLGDSYYGGLTVDYSKLRVNSGGGSNGVENRVVRNLSDTEKMALWVRVFDNVMIKFFGEHKDLVMRKKYIEHKKKYQICREAAIAPRTYDRWLFELLYAAYGWATEFKLL